YSASYDDRGYRTELTYFDRDRKPVAFRDGYASVKARYDARGHRLEEEYLGPDGKPVALKDGYASRKAEYDAIGNLLEATTRDAAAKPCLNWEGYATVRYKYSHNRACEVAYFGTDGKPVLTRYLGVARIVYDYDDRGNRSLMACFGTDDKPIAC